MSEHVGRKSGGPWVDAGAAQQEAVPADAAANYERVPPEELREPQFGQDTPTLVKTLVVRDAQGQIVSVTKVAPNAKFGVGVKLQPGHTVKEFEAGSLAGDPVDGGK
jgi:hypothetical protein